MRHHINRFEEMLTAATARVARDYFQLPVADADAAYRERVYCYELYHQLRCVWDDFPFSLGGEVDKVGSPHFRDGPYAQAKPDLLVHVPGEMGHNLATVEVKPCDRSVGAFREDLEKLAWFCQSAGYFRGLFLVYGTPQGGEGAVRAKVQHAVHSSARVDPQFIEAFHHGRVGSAATGLDI
jgi:hypothetical protein